MTSEFRSGEMVLEWFDYDGGRPVRVYVPPSPPWAIVYAGDGQLIAEWGPMLEASDLPPTMIVAADRVGDEDLRLKEYSPKFDPKRFETHETFFVKEMGDWIKARFDVALPAERTAVCGVSASGEFSLAMGLRHPEIFGVTFSASPGAGYQPPVVMPDRLPRTYLVAGLQEPFFLDNAKRWAEALDASGADVMMVERDAGHDDTMWREEFPRMIRWAFGDENGD